MTKQQDWENIEKCGCGRNSVCHINKKDGTKVYFCWRCFFKYEGEQD